MDDITGTIVDCGLKTHRDLGPSMFESVYEATLAHLLAARGLRLRCQQVLGIESEGLTIEHAFRVDMIVEDRVIVEIKSAEKLAPVHGKQLLTYLRLCRIRVGLLLNFGAPTFEDGIRRFVCDSVHSGSRSVSP